MLNYISIVIPTYNRPLFLSRLLTSISIQTYKHFEVIIIDDHSSCQNDYENVISDYRYESFDIIYERNTQSFGAPYSRNKGIKLSKYDLIALVDDDDEWMAEKLELQVSKYLENQVDVGIVYGWANAIKNDEVCFEYRSNIEGKALKHILKECFIPSPTVLVTKKAIADAGYFDENMPSCQDWDMWTRILSLGYRCVVVKKVIAKYHKHNLDSVGCSARANEGYRKYFIKHFSKNLFFLNFNNIKKTLKLLIIYYFKK